MERFGAPLRCFDNANHGVPKKRPATPLDDTVQPCEPTITSLKKTTERADIQKPLSSRMVARDAQGCRIPLTCGYQGRRGVLESPLLNTFTYKYFAASGAVPFRRLSKPPQGAHPNARRTDLKMCGQRKPPHMLP